jgi:hypothetical protein
VTKLLQAGRIGEAREALTRNGSRVSPEEGRSIEALILDAELTERVRGIKTAKDAEAAFVLIDRADSLLPASRVEEFRTFIILNEGKRLAAEQGPEASIAYTEDAIARYGSNGRLRDALRVYQQNRITALHNSFAELFNRRDFDGARRVLRGGLAEYPGNRQLQSDLDRLEQVLRQTEGRRPN